MQGTFSTIDVKGSFFELKIKVFLRYSVEKLKDNEIGKSGMNDTNEWRTQYIPRALESKRGYTGSVSPSTFDKTDGLRYSNSFKRF